jgi:hypothetical protein
VGVLVGPEGFGFHDESFAVRVVGVGHGAAASEVIKRGSRQYTGAVLG